jgi:hypothetical protein
MIQLLLEEALKSARARRACLGSGELLQRSFFAWISSTIETPGNTLDLEQELADIIGGSSRNIQAVSSMGFISSISKDSNALATFKSGVDWMLGRAATGASIQGIISEPLVKLGLLVGIIQIADPTLSKMYRDWCSKLPSHQLNVAENSWRTDVAKIHSSWLQSASLALRVENVNAVELSLHSKSVSTGPDSWEAQTLAEGVLQRLLRAVYDDAEQPAFDLMAYECLIATAAAIRVGAVSLEDLQSVLSRISSALRRWTWETAVRVRRQEMQKWKILHEYHFQNLLTCLLAPLFPDLRDEEWLSSIGQKTPRADLVIPSIQTVIEVKYWRNGVKVANMISEIAEDASLYLKAGSPYKFIVPVIWDQAARTEEHGLLKSGLSEFHGVRGPTVVSAPAFMRQLV